MKNKKISFVLCTFNGEKTIRECLNSIFNQDYPKNKIELNIADGGSKDNTKKIINEFIKKYPKNIVYMNNKKIYSEGKGFGKDIVSRNVNGDIIAFIDQDNILVQKDWIKRMLVPFEENDIHAVQSRMAIMKDTTLIDKYLSAIGIEDPFAIPYSINSQIILNPKKLEYKKDKEYFVYTANKNNFLYAGNNGFFIKKQVLKKINGYTQDIDNFYRMTKHNFKIAIPKDAKIHHKTSTKFREFIKKRKSYVNYYLFENYHKRDFYWFSIKNNSFHQNMFFIQNVIFNLLIIPRMLTSFRQIIKEKRFYWIIHPFVLFVLTLVYFYSYSMKSIKKTIF